MIVYTYNRIRLLAKLFMLIIVSSPFTVRAQSIDSLISTYTDQKGIVNIDSIISVARSFFYNYPVKALETGLELVDIAESQKDFLGKANSLRLLGAYYADVRMNFDSAYFYYQRAESLYKGISSKEASEGKGAILHNYGSINHYQGNYPEAIGYYTEALRVFDRIGDLKTRPKTLNNLSTLYSYVNDNKKAEMYARKTIELSRQIGDKFMIATGNIALASTLIEQNTPESNEIEALLEENLKISEINNLSQVKISTHLNYGNYYATLKKEYHEAIRQYRKALELTQLSPNNWDIVRICINLSEALSHNNQFDEAAEFAQKALSISREIATKDTEQRALMVQSTASAHNLNFKSAYDDLILAYHLRDTLMNEDVQRQLALLETEYESDKKELRISNLEKQQLLYNSMSIAGAIVLLISLAFAVIRYRLAVSKRKLAEQDIKRMEQERQLVAVQATLDGEAAERTRLAKDLHDGLGSMLSVVKLNLPQMNGGVILEVEDVSRFQKAMGMLDESIQELRRVAHHMMPESLLRYGLKVSLTDFCDAIPMVNFHYFGNEARLPEKLEMMIYRSIHELVNNALKHAEASHINVQLVQEADRLSFTVQDDGKGFDPNSVSEGMGLSNIRQRVEAYQGKMSVYSSPQQGTEIHVELELTKNDKE